MTDDRWRRRLAMYGKILVCLDGSELAELALPYAEELAGRLGSEVHLLSVGDSAEAEDYHKQEVYLEQVREATKRGAERYRGASSDGAVQVKGSVVVGRAADEILDYGDKEGVGLIVMATHGRSGIRRWALGSVAEKVVRASKRPVVLVRARGARGDLREKGVLNRVLVPLDGSKGSETVLPYVEELGAGLNPELVLMRVVSPIYPVYNAEQLAWEQASRVGAENYLEEAADGLRRKRLGVSTEIRQVEGDTAADEIVKLADEIGADMVAMSTHGQTGVRRWALGSVADKVLHGGNTPVMMVKIPGAAMV